MQLCSAAAIAGPAPRRWDALQCELKHSCIASTLVPCSCRVYLPNQGAVPGVEHGRCPPIVRRNAKTRAIYAESTTCARLLAVCRTSAAIGGRHSSPNEHCRRTRRLDNARKVHFRHCTLLQLANNCNHPQNSKPALPNRTNRTNRTNHRIELELATCVTSGNFTALYQIVHFAS